MAGKSEEAKAKAREYSRRYYHERVGKEKHAADVKARDSTPEGRIKKAVRAKRYYDSTKQKETRAAYHRAYYADPEKKAHHKHLVREGHLRRNYGLTVAERNAMFLAQGGLCLICGRTAATGRYKQGHIDHDHQTGKVRGILCFSCNVMLGSAKDNIDTLQRAIEYIRKHSS